VHTTEKNVKANETVLLQVHNYQSKEANLSFSDLLDKNYIIMLLACDETPKYCCLLV
jgi:hypothetical protein